MDGNKKSFGNLSTHFWIWEFRCPCKKCEHKKVQVSPLLLSKLEKMIWIIDKDIDYHKPVIVLSGNRCKEYNKKIGGHPNSAHIPKPEGQAVDITVEGMTSIELGLIAEEVGGLRIGIARWGMHGDVRPPGPSRFWFYLGKKGIVYSADIENKNLSKFYKIMTEGR